MLCGTHGLHLALPATRFAALGRLLPAVGSGRDARVFEALTDNVRPLLLLHTERSATPSTVIPIAKQMLTQLFPEDNCSDNVYTEFS